KRSGQHDTQPEQSLPPFVRLQSIEAANNISGRHRTDPWDQRVRSGNCNSRERIEPARRMQDIPKPGEGPKTLRLDRITQIVTSDHNDREQRNRPARQINESRENDHRAAQLPNDQQPSDVIIEIKLPAETANDG